MHEQPADRPVEDATTPVTGKPYDSPTLRDYGTVSELTLSNAAGPNFDGGSGANIYAS